MEIDCAQNADYDSDMASPNINAESQESGLAWIKTMDHMNFLAIYDVMLDIKSELNISPDHIVFPLLRNKIRFTELFPADGVNMRDDYCEARWKGAQFLERSGIITKLGHQEGNHRWETRLDLHVDSGRFHTAMEEMDKEYRVRSGGKESKFKGDTTMPWGLLHPKVASIARSRFEAGHRADAVESALKEINDLVKEIVRQSTNQEFDGADLMNRAFSIQNPIVRLDDLSTETGRNVQKGFMQIFAGSMTGVRNPKAHKNIEIDEQHAMHLLFLASLLMFKIGEKK